MLQTILFMLVLYSIVGLFTFVICKTKVRFNGLLIASVLVALAIVYIILTTIF